MAGVDSAVLLTTRQAAQQLRQSEAFVRSLCRSGALACRVVNRRYYIPERALYEFAAPDVQPQAVTLPRKWKGRKYCVA